MNELKACRYGQMLFNRHDMYIGRSLQLYGEFSEGECEVFRQIVRRGSTVVEVGSNIGSHTVPLAQWAGPEGKVIAFEPQRIVFQTLCANVALNSLLNVHCLQQAVGSEPGSIVVPHINYQAENNFGGLGLGSFTHGERVPLVTIDSLELQTCDLVKLDIEGMEREAILGAQRTIEKFKPALYVENDRKDRSDDLVRTLDAMGYAMYWHLPPYFNPKNFAGNSENVFGNLVSKNMICFHQSRPHQIDAQRVEVPASSFNP
jgi:FkbM family methyltransferase